LTITATDLLSGKSLLGGKSPLSGKSPLGGKTILITGSSRGIGASIAKLAAAYGAKVILHGKTQSAELVNLASEIGAEYISCDVSDELQVKKAVEALGEIDVLVNSAGVNLSKPFLEQTTESWKETFDVNVLGTVNFSKAVLPQMIRNRQGKIINIASIKGYLHIPGSTAYAASKAAIMSLTSNMAKEFAPHILVNAVAPGFTDTTMTEKTLTDRIRKQIDQIPLKRMARPEEIAEVILFLASDKCNYMTGETIKVSGGL